MDMVNVKWRTGIRHIGFSALLCGMFLGICAKTVEAALLEGLLGGFEETLGESAQEKGERLIIGNFYQAEKPTRTWSFGCDG